MQEGRRLDTDDAWKRWGEQDPYFGVLTDERFRSRNLTAEAKAEFLASGEGHVGHVIETLRRHCDPQFSARSVLDFGCGVGRLVVPFARIAERVVGMDISEGMLAEARRNCEAAAVSNATFVTSDDSLSRLEGKFDLVHSVIVFQHIPPERGVEIFERLVQRIAPGGAGALQVTYGKRVHAAHRGQPQRESTLRRLARRVRAAVMPSGSADPEMQMNVYPLGELMFILQSAGVARTHAEFTDHGGELGVALYFTKPR